MGLGMSDPAVIDGPAITLNALLGGRVQLAQPAEGYRVAIDPVLLAATIAAAPGERVLDLGCGVGAAALCLAARLPEIEIAGLERQELLATLAVANARRNGVEARVTFIQGDLRAAPPALAPASFASASFAPASFAQVMINPPFLSPGRHTPSAHPGKALADGEGEVRLEHWLAAAARWLQPRGRLTLIHRADRIDDLVAALRPRFGSLILYPLWPKAGRPARRLLLQARLGGRSPAVFAPGLVLHREDGRFTAEAEAVLRGGAGLGMGELR